MQYVYNYNAVFTERKNEMIEPFFYNGKTVPMEDYIQQCDSYEDFENKYVDEFLKEENRIGYYLEKLLAKYDRKDSVVSFDAHLHHSYVGNIVREKKNNPSRNALICICFAMGATEEELQYLLKYAGHSPLYVRRRRDVIIWFGIKKGESLETVNENLKARNLPPLYKEE